MFYTKSTFDKLFDETLINMLSDFKNKTDFKIKKESMKIDNDTLVADFDVPGLSKDDFKIMVEDTTLVIDGTTETRKFFKSYKLQKDWDIAKIEAKVKDGILTIDIPKREEKKAKLITVDVK